MGQKKYKNKEGGYLMNLTEEQCERRVDTCLIVSKTKKEEFYKETGD